jgi:hypothetical protein
MNDLLILSKNIDLKIRKNEGFAMLLVLVGLVIFLCFPIISNFILSTFSIKDNTLANILLYLIFTSITIYILGYMHRQKQNKIFLQIKELLNEDKIYGLYFHLNGNSGLSNYLNKHSYMNLRITNGFEKIADKKILSVSNYEELNYSTILKELKTQMVNYEQEVKEYKEKVEIEARIDKKLEKVDIKTKMLKVKILQHELLNMFNKIKSIFSKRDPNKGKVKKTKSKILKL